MDAPKPIEQEGPDDLKPSRPSGLNSFLLIKAAVIALAAWWIYSPALHGQWLWDDNTNITENPLMRDPRALWKIWFAPTSLDYYPLQMSVEWIQWQLWGNDTLGYHLTNVVLQVLDAFLFWRLLGKLGVRLAWLGGLVFVVHPMMVESVAWIVEVKNGLSLAFLLLSFSVWISRDNERSAPISRESEKGGAAGTAWRSWAKTGPSDAKGVDSGYGPEGAAGTRRPASEEFRFRSHPSSFCHTLSLALFVLSMLSKASVVMFPAVLLLHAWWRRGKVTRRDVLATAPFFAVSIAMGLVAIWLQQHRAIGAVTIPMGGFLSRAAVAGLGAVFYLWKFLVPVGLMPLYPRWNVDPPSVLQFLPWALLAATVIGLFYGRKKAQKAQKNSDICKNILFGMGVFLLNLAPVSGFFTVSFMRLTWVMDHLAYVSLLGLIGLAVAAVGKCESEIPKARPVPLFAVRSSLFLLFLGLAVESRAYARVFASGETYWSYAVDRNPDSPAARYNLGLMLVESGRFPEAIDQWSEAVRLDPDYAEAQLNLANALSQSGRPGEAVPHFEQALRLKPANAVAHYNFGLALRDLGRIDEARAQLMEAARLSHLQADP